MAKTVKKETSPIKSSYPQGNKPFEFKKQHKVVIGFLLLLFSIALLVAFSSYFINGQADQSILNSITDRSQVAQNWLGKMGAYLADLFIYKGFGVASFILVIEFSIL